MRLHICACTEICETQKYVLIRGHKCTHVHLCAFRRAMVSTHECCICVLSEYVSCIISSASIMCMVWVGELIVRRTFVRGP
jgi:hypothetical protein